MMKTLNQRKHITSQNGETICLVCFNSCSYSYQQFGLSQGTKPLTKLRAILIPKAPWLSEVLKVRHNYWSMSSTYQIWLWNFSGRISIIWSVTVSVSNWLKGLQFWHAYPCTRSSGDRTTSRKLEFPAGIGVLFL